jgi:hypothetical protein
MWAAAWTEEGRLSNMAMFSPLHGAMKRNVEASLWNNVSLQMYVCLAKMRGGGVGGFSSD